MHLAKMNVSDVSHRKMWIWLKSCKTGVDAPRIVVIGQDAANRPWKLMLDLTYISWRTRRAATV